MFVAQLGCAGIGKTTWFGGDFLRPWSDSFHGLSATGCDDWLDKIATGSTSSHRIQSRARENEPSKTRFAQHILTI